MIAPLLAAFVVAATPTAAPSPTPAPAPKKITPAKLAVLDVQLTGRDTAGLDAAALTDLLGSAIEDPEVFRTTTSRDLSAMLGLEKLKQMSGCTEDTSCLAEIAGSLGVDYLASASIGSLEGRLVISARLVDVKRASVMARSSETVEARAAAPAALQRVGLKLRNAYRASRGLAPATEPASGGGVVWGGWLGAVAAPSESVAGGEALLTLDAGAWEFGAGVTIASRAALRLTTSRSVTGKVLSLRLGVKALVGSVSGGKVFGGGPAAWLRWNLTSWLDADLVGSAEYLKGPTGGSLVPMVGVGLHAFVPN